MIFALLMIEGVVNNKFNINSKCSDLLPSFKQDDVIELARASGA